ncbi:hypothetical protein BCV71DRAFT_237886 [Rhizopus microsporus]|uniref:Uncharacterized protein n=1 Tax=Rhizopus microsporus TaxID=58291 RepID=A0A1X0RST6_RHIZD|nr:hypothetical protein BCV71DRAFT_237886 [Rhizopus microsporus]
MSNGRALDNNKAIFGKQQTIAAVEHADKTTTASKKKKLPELLKQLIEEQLSVEDVPDFSMNDMNLKETDLLREFVAEDTLKEFIEKHFKNSSNERKQKQKDYSELLEELPEEIRDLLIKDIDHEADEAVNKEYNTLRPNTANSCYIDAIFELLWYSVMPHFEEVILSNFDPHNKFDSILKTSYKWHRSNTDDGRNRASYSLRKFVWENKINNRDKGF